MNFEFSEDQVLLKNQIRRALDDHCRSADVRQILESDSPHDSQLWRVLCEMGVQGTAIDDSLGGAGAGYLELCVVAEELGRALAPVPFSSSIFLAVEALKVAANDEQKLALLPGLASGEKIGTLAAWEINGPLQPDTIAMRWEEGVLNGRKILVPDGDVADVAIVIARDDEGLSLFAVDLTDSGVTRETLETIDPSRNFSTLTFNAVAAQRLGDAGDGWNLLEQVLNRAAVLVAFEQIGGAQKALEMATDYAQERYAFGRPIGSFQAVKHMLADMYVDLELARSNCYYGAWALSTDADELPLAAATARVSATQAFQHCSKNNIQTHGGMGFTWEFDCHLFYRRSNLLAVLLGGQSVWKDRLVSQLESSDAA